MHTPVVTRARITVGLGSTTGDIATTHGQHYPTDVQQIHFIDALDDPPTLDFAVPAATTLVRPFAYCNKHGFYQGNATAVTASTTARSCAPTSCLSMAMPTAAPAPAPHGAAGDGSGALRVHCTSCRWVFFFAAPPAYFVLLPGLAVWVLLSLLVNCVIADAVERRMRRAALWRTAGRAAVAALDAPLPDTDWAQAGVVGKDAAAGLPCTVAIADPERWPPDARAWLDRVEGGNDRGGWVGPPTTRQEESARDPFHYDRGSPTRLGADERAALLAAGIDPREVEQRRAAAERDRDAEVERRRAAGISEPEPGWRRTRNSHPSVLASAPRYDDVGDGAGGDSPEASRLGRSAWTAEQRVAPDGCAYTRL
eukprot:gene32496-29722_t